MDIGKLLQPRFSRRTVLAAVDALLAGSTHAHLSTVLTDLGPEIYGRVRGEEVSAAKRINDFKQLLDKSPSLTVDDGLLVNVIVEMACSHAAPREPEHSWSRTVPPTAEWEHLVRCLEQDGYLVLDGTLRRTLPSELALPQAESELVRLLKLYGFATSLGHLEQALDAHARGNWAGANGQIRTFFDSLFDELLARIDASSGLLPSGHARRAKLASLGFLSLPLNEWENEGRGFLNGLGKRLHPQGSHPGLSDEDDSTYRMHVVLLTAVMMMRRLHRRLTPNASF